MTALVLPLHMCLAIHLFASKATRVGNVCS